MSPIPRPSRLARLTRQILAPLALSAGLLAPMAGTAEARGVRVIVPPAPFFFPVPQFHYDDGGYYRRHDGSFYHYDHDRDGWHYGRNDAEGMRYESRHAHR